jgi:photosystem II stability/assembly factor-like uncharacterized protein
MFLLSYANAQQSASIGQPIDAPVDEGTIRRALLAERRSDARLNDVYYITPTTGWAVGDCGTIWNTQDGGEHWTLQESGVSCPLFCIDFIDSQNGFAVGGMTEPYSHRGIGVVLKTANGGQNWERVTSATFPLLYCVRIDAPGKLWVAGTSSEQCLTGILRSSDNGTTWQKQSGAQTAGWSSLEFFDAKTAAGIGLDGTIRLFPNARLLPNNGKPSPMPTFGLRRLNAISISTGRQGTKGTQGTLGTQESSKLLMSLMPLWSILSPASLISLQNSPLSSAWLVGDGGVIVCSRNGGGTWELPPASVPLQRPDLFDFQTVFARENNIWVAGNPGTKIFFSHDGGVHWRQAFTGVSVPIRKIRFISPQHGFAVGELGTILATADGGHSWQIQRDGGKRLAVLGIFGRVQDVPYEAFAQLCLEDGYLGGVEILFRQDSMTRNASSNNNEIPAMRRVHEALTQCGGTCSTQPWAFSLDLDELTGGAERGISRILQRIEQENNGSGLTRLREHLVAAIRTFRPTIIITSGNVPTEESDTENPAILADPIRELLQREIVAAVQAAADPNMYPEQLSEAGLRLQTWQTDKVHLCYNETAWQRKDILQHLRTQDVFRKAAAREGNVQLFAQAVNARHGKTPENMAKDARMLTESKPLPTMQTLSFRTVFDIAAVRQNKNPAELNGGSLMTGVTLTAGSEARRMTSNLSMIPYFESLQQQQQYQESARNIIAGLGKGTLTDGNRVVSQAENLTRRLDRETAIQTLFEMGNRLAQTGRHDAAADIFQHVIQRDPRHFLAGQANQWLLKYLCGFREKTTPETRIGNWEHPLSESLLSHEFLSSQGFANDTVNGSTSDNPPTQAEQLAALLNQQSPDLASDPHIRFCLAAQRGYGNLAAAEMFYTTRSMRTDHDVWATRAASELAVLRFQTQTLKTLNREQSVGAALEALLQSGDSRNLPAISCYRAKERPFLDGNFNEPVWANHPATPFTQTQSQPQTQHPTQETPEDGRQQAVSSGQQAAGSEGAEIRFAYDNEFLYFALQCRKSRGFAYRFTETPRPYDPNLLRQDRVEILLDSKRNFTTFDTLELDNRGWVRDARQQDQTWNPQWFVARNEDAECWYIEAAFPLNQLADQPPLRGSVWCVALRRLIPAVAAEAWNAEYSFQTSEGFGYLAFE